MVIDSYRTQLSTYESRSEQRNNPDITNKIINVKIYNHEQNSFISRCCLDGSQCICN